MKCGYIKPKRIEIDPEEVTSNGYQEALEKAAQTADLLRQDLQALYAKAQGVAEGDLFYGYIEQVARMKGMLNRIVAEKSTVK